MKPQASYSALSGVLVTRPAHQNQPLIELIQKAGLSAIAFPVIEIDHVTPDDRLRQLLSELVQYQLIIFISVNAVKKALELMSTTGQSITRPVLAIGRSTARALQNAHLMPINLDKPASNSETLLQHESLQPDAVNAHKIVIFRGQKGREYLADQLRLRGATVDYAEVYKRIVPKADTGSLIKQWQQSKIHLVTVTSNEALQNLYDMLGQNGRDLLLKTPLLVPGERTLSLARKLGFHGDTIQAASAIDADMMLAITNWKNSQ